MSEDYTDRDKWPDKLLVDEFAYVKAMESMTLGRDEYADALETEILRRMQPAEWISVEGRLPVDGTDVILYFPKAKAVTTAFFASGKFSRYRCECVGHTAWAPLPPPPEGEM